MQPNKSSLNLDTIPDSEFLDRLSKYHPKICSELIKDISTSQGMISSDEKLYKTMSIAAERLILKILKQVREANSKSQKESTIKEVITYRDISQALEVLISTDCHGRAKAAYIGGLGLVIGFIHPEKSKIIQSHFCIIIFILDSHWHSMAS